MQPHETLAKQPIFVGLSASEIKELESQCRWRRVEAQRWLLDFGEGGTDVFFVSHGRLRVVRLSAGREVILRDLDEGDFFGELAAIDGEPRSAGIVAVTDSIVGRMSAPHFLAAIRRHPGVCEAVLRRLAFEVRKLANQVNELSTMKVANRLRTELIRLARPSAREEKVWVITPPPTHAELAARIGTHREGVAREMKALERAGLVERRRGALALKDLQSLREAAETES